jgi:hypothetical protein
MNPPILPNSPLNPEPSLLERIRYKIQLWRSPAYWEAAGTLQYSIVGGIALCLFLYVVAWMWGGTPGQFDVLERAHARAAEAEPALSAEELPPGYLTVSTLMDVANGLTDKSGGYLYNDMLPPGLLMDNAPSWESGALNEIRAFATALQTDLTQAPGAEADQDIANALTEYSVDADAWLFPSLEGALDDGNEYLSAYLTRLGDEDPANAHFSDHTQNLNAWLTGAEKRLQDLAYRLGSSVQSGTLQEGETAPPKTSWFKIDNVFYEARGTGWALLHLLRAVEQDFHRMRDDAAMKASIRNAIRTLEGTQKGIWTPMIMNGYEFGLFPNHSLAMAAYMGRAAQAVSHLRDLIKG